MCDVAGFLVKMQLTSRQRFGKCPWLCRCHHSAARPGLNTGLWILNSGPTLIPGASRCNQPLLSSISADPCGTGSLEQCWERKQQKQGVCNLNLRLLPAPTRVHPSGLGACPPLPPPLFLSFSASQIESFLYNRFVRSQHTCISASFYLFYWWNILRIPTIAHKSVLPCSLSRQSRFVLQTLC